MAGACRAQTPEAQVEVGERRGCYAYSLSEALPEDVEVEEEAPYGGGVRTRTPAPPG